MDMASMEQANQAATGNYMNRWYGGETDSTSHSGLHQEYYNSMAQAMHCAYGNNMAARMTSSQVFRPHFPSSLHPWLGAEKGVMGSTSPSWHSPFTKTSSQYSHSSSTPTTPYSNSYSYTSSGLFSSFGKDEGMTASSAAAASSTLEYPMGGGSDVNDLKSASMLSPLSACANKSGREGLNYSSSSMGVSGGGSGGTGVSTTEASTPLLASYPHYPSSLQGAAADFHNPYYANAAHFNKTISYEKPKSNNKPSRSSAGKMKSS